MGPKLRWALVATALAGGAVPAGCGDGDDPSDGARESRSRARAPARTAVVPGPCRTLRARVTGEVADPAVSELSGLVRSRSQRGVLWSHEDSGSAPLLYALRADGRIAGRFEVAGAEAIDWEDIAGGPGTAGRPLLYLGDIGDNGAQRETVDVYRVPEPVVGGAAVTAPAARLRLRYPDGAHDAETLLVDPRRGELVIVTKGVDGGRAYRTSARLPAGGEATLRAGPLVRVGLATAGDVSADGRIVALRGYAEVAAWRRRGREPLTATLGRAPCVSPTSLSEGQGEALALDRRGETFQTVTEGSPALLRRYTPR